MRHTHTHTHTHHKTPSSEGNNYVCEHTAARNHGTNLQEWVRAGTACMSMDLVCENIAGLTCW